MSYCEEAYVGTKLKSVRSIALIIAYVMALGACPRFCINGNNYCQ